MVYKKKTQRKKYLEARDSLGFVAIDYARIHISGSVKLLEFLYSDSFIDGIVEKQREKGYPTAQAASKNQAVVAAIFAGYFIPTS